MRTVRRTGGGGRRRGAADTAPKTKTPHDNVGNKNPTRQRGELFRMKRSKSLPASTHILKQLPNVKHLQLPVILNSSQLPYSSQTNVHPTSACHANYKHRAPKPKKHRTPPGRTSHPLENTKCRACHANSKHRAPEPKEHQTTPGRTSHPLEPTKGRRECV